MTLTAVENFRKTVKDFIFDHYLNILSEGCEVARNKYAWLEYVTSTIHMQIWECESNKNKRFSTKKFNETIAYVHDLIDVLSAAKYEDVKKILDNCSHDMVRDSDLNLMTKKDFIVTVLDHVSSKNIVGFIEKWVEDNKNSFDEYEIDDLKFEISGARRVCSNVCEDIIAWVKENQNSIGEPLANDFISHFDELNKKHKNIDDIFDDIYSFVEENQDFLSAKLTNDFYDRFAIQFYLYDILSSESDEYDKAAFEADQKSIKKLEKFAKNNEEKQFLEVLKNSGHSEWCAIHIFQAAYGFNIKERAKSSSKDKELVM